MTSPADPLILTIPQVAELLSVHQATLRRQVERTGEVFPGVRVIRLSPGRQGVYRAALVRALEEAAQVSA